MAHGPELTSGLDPGIPPAGRRRATGGKLALIAALLVAVATAGGIASFESLTSTATNGSASPYNEFSTGTVTLTDNQSATAVFTVTNANPGATGKACIAVEYTGSIPSDVYLYDTVKQDTGANGSGTAPYLGQNVTLAATDGSDTATYATGTNNDTSCTTFTANTTTSYATNTTVGNDVNTVNLDDSTGTGSDCTGATGSAAGDCWPTTLATGYLMSSVTSGAASATWPDSSVTPTVVWYQFSYAISASAPAGATVEVELTWEAVGQ